jgi:hypothetical protein
VHFCHCAYLSLCIFVCAFLSLCIFDTVHI